MFRLGLVLALFTVAQAQFRSPTGRRVSHSAFRNGLPQPIFEISEGYLLGPNTHIHIGSQTSRINSFIPDEAMTRINMNGNHEISRRRSTTEVRFGRGLTFLFANGKLASVSGESLNLIPLKGYAGLFIDTSVSQAQPTVLDPDEDDDTVPIPETNGTQSSRNFFSSAKQSSCAAGDRHFYEIAIAYDNSFCAEFGHNEEAASAMVQVLVDGSNVAYTRDTCITLSLVHIEAHCNDPRDPYATIPSLTTCPGLPNGYECTSARKILFNFRAFWLFNRVSVQRDAAILLTGFEDGTNTAGIAFVGSACTQSAYGWVEGIRLKTFAHEVGHTLGAGHRTSEGIMRQGNVMNFGFLPETIAEFKAFVDRPTFCLTTASPVCDVSNGGCSATSCPNGQCIQGNDVKAPSVPCSPITGYYNCLYEIFPTYFLAVDCPNDGFSYVLRENDPSDPSIFCCDPPSESASRSMIIRFKSSLGLLGVSGTIYNNFVRYPSQITTETLMKTTGRRCTAPTSTMTATPTAKPTMTPTMTPAATPTTTASATATGASTPRATPTTSATSSPSASPSTSNKPLRRCRDAMPQGYSFACFRRRFMRIRKRRVGAIDMTVQQRFGLVRLTAKPRSGTELISMRVKISTRASPVGTLLPTAELVSTKTEYSLIFNPFSAFVASGRKHCCRMPLYFNMEVAFKNTASGAAAYGKVNAARSRLRCGRICRKFRGKMVGTVVPFSIKTECPFCETAKH